MTRLAIVRPANHFEVEVAPPLGPMAVSAYAKQETDADVRLFDLQLSRLSDEALAHEMRGFDPGLIGFSSLTCHAPDVARLSASLRRHFPGIPQIVGGPHGTAQSAQIIEDMPAVDFAVVGEGEHAVADLVAWREGRLGASRIRGVVRRENGNAVRNEAGAPIEDIDLLPFLDYGLVDMNAFERAPRTGFVRKKKKYFAMFTSRGCPYRCNYCHLVFGKTFRFQSADRVLDELDLLYHRYGVREFQMFDDIFNLRRDRAIAVFRGIVRRGYDIAISFPNGIRVDILDAEVADWMRRAGVVFSVVSIESATPRLQKQMRKNLRLDKARRGIELLVERGIFTRGAFMMGFPGETREELLATARFARESKLHGASFYFVLPLPGTPLYEQFESVVGRRQARMKQQTHNADPNMSAVSLAAVSPDELRRIVRAAYLRFYLNPARVWRILRDVPRKTQLLTLSLTAVLRSWLPHAEFKIYEWKDSLRRAAGFA
ncbi:MAG: B12-binding domain-containing radical SAM protein [Deltaproteobacteria bacterium]|nr:B12-binding domain-containing radical SAM protein [Deltaproteobacteria bacterium]